MSGRLAHGILGRGVPVVIGKAAPQHFGDERLIKALVVLVDAAAGEAENLGLDAGQFIHALPDSVKIAEIGVDRSVNVFVHMRIGVNPDGMAARRHIAERVR